MKNDSQKKQVEMQTGKPCVDTKDMPKQMDVKMPMMTSKKSTKGMMK
jgi:hypothetical protein